MVNWYALVIGLVVTAGIVWFLERFFFRWFPFPGRKYRVVIWMLCAGAYIQLIRTFYSLDQHEVDEICKLAWMATIFSLMVTLYFLSRGFSYVEAGMIAPNKLREEIKSFTATTIDFFKVKLSFKNVFYFALWIIFWILIGLAARSFVNKMNFPKWWAFFFFLSYLYCSIVTAFGGNSTIARVGSGTSARLYVLQLVVLTAAFAAVTCGVLPTPQSERKINGFDVDALDLLFTVWLAIVSLLAYDGLMRRELRRISTSFSA